MLDSKSQGGIISIYQMPAALHRWFLASHEREAITMSLKSMYGMRVRRGGGGALGKKFCLEMSKRGAKVPPRYVGQKECACSAQIRQN